MTRFGVMRHLDVLETAGLISTRKVGREKRHYLNPVPIRRIHDRWISKYAAPVVGTMSAIKDHLEAPPMAVPSDEIEHVYSIYINAEPERSGAPSPMATRRSSTTTEPRVSPTGRSARA
jgi:hypothetical protein